MRRLAVPRLLLCAVLFAAWMAYLGFLVATRPEVPTGPRVLSRPQALTSTLDIVGRIDKPDTDEVVVERVLYSAGPGAPREGQTLRVINLPDCGTTLRDNAFQRDITIPGSYLLLLTRTENQSLQVTALPPSPGFSFDRRRPRAYAATPDILAQYRQVQKPSRE
jgi:hypothetical protein